jgi:hypothetical protein
MLEQSTSSLILINLPGQQGHHHQIRNKIHQEVVHSFLERCQQRSERSEQILIIIENETEYASKDLTETNKF